MATARIFAEATPEQRQELYDLERHPRTPKSALWRIQIITLSLNNISATEIKKITRHTMKTVLRIIHGFNANGLEAQFERDHLGRTARFTQEMENFVLELVRGELPKNAVSITETVNQVFSNKLKTPLTLDCVYYHLQRMGLSWQRSRYVPKGQADADDKAQEVQKLNELKKWRSRR
jgi:transposase